MADDEHERDLSTGVPIEAFAETSMVAGKLGDEALLLVRTATGYGAFSGKCTHAGAPLHKGVLVAGMIRCPWHHACFDAETGAMTAAPALRSLGRWAVEERDGRVFVGEKLRAEDSPRREMEGRIIVVGAGAAGAAAADALARLGYASATTLIGSDPEPPYDRTMLSKHYLAGAAGDDALPLNVDDLSARGVDVRLATTVASIEPEGRTLTLQDGTALPYAKLILATGAEPKRLDVPGAELPHVRTLRSAADARGIVAALGPSSRVVVVGSSFIGLEVAAALHDRKLTVTVVTPEERPFAKTLGTALSDAIMAKHREIGTVFRLGRKVSRIEPGRIWLDNGASLDADLVIVGIGVTPRTSLAAEAGLGVEEGIVVDERLRTSQRDIFAVGDIACWPDPHTGTSIRVEHWAVAQRQGQVAAVNAVGGSQRYDVVPFFWTLQHDFSFRFVGHASGEDVVSVEGDPGADAAVHYGRDGRELAVATVERDLVALEVEIGMERRLGQPAVSLAERR